MAKTIEQQHQEFAKFLTNALDNVSHKYTQMEVAKLIGFKQPSILSIMKKGDAKMPLDKIAPLARVLDVDRNELFRLALGQYYADEGLKNMLECFGGLPADEERILAAYREKKEAAGSAMNPRDFAVEILKSK